MSQTSKASIVAIAACCLAGVGALATFSTHTPARQARATNPRPRPLVVLTLNIAHGRGEALNQALLRRGTIERNLDDVAAVLSRIQPDVAALQEADGPSIWSGRFNHVDRLAEAAGFEHMFRGSHVDGFGLDYGAALLSRTALQHRDSVRFAPSPPTPPKGFVVATVDVPAATDSKVDVVSVHLDFASARVRRRQLDRLADSLEARSRPRIVAGDFNCGWDDADRALRSFCERLQLSAFQPDVPEVDAATFPSTGQRLDWILVSPELEITDCRVLPDVVSDHRAVVAVISPAVIPSAGWRAIRPTRP